MICTHHGVVRTTIDVETTAASNAGGTAEAGAGSLHEAAWAVVDADIDAAVIGDVAVEAWLYIDLTASVCGQCDAGTGVVCDHEIGGVTAECICNGGGG